MKKIVIFCVYFLIFTLISVAFTQDEWEKLATEWDDFDEGEAAPAPEPAAEVVETPPPQSPPPDPAYQPPAQAYQPPAPPPSPGPAYQPPAQAYPPQPPAQAYQPPQPPAQAYQPPQQPAPATQPQPPARTVVPPSITLVFGQQQPNPQAPPQAVPRQFSPPAGRRPINVMPQMPYPYSVAAYRVQLGSYSSTELARQCFNRLQSAGFNPYYEQYGSLYRVVLVGIKAADMPAIVQRLDAAGFTEAWLREER